ncbi:glycoside hydrolase family 16 protein [Trichoderma citrinoviride]|uniref:Glycoside hydrolase family 16 protein n=1 Tax=Trichoderma citrinoviride TaxID=58853 RepID=A0A2T4AXY0_9HYPO|nr:glycoside hydrolase family 16 protein [Trichoderma citrinoviride]PTB61940.1 glycoside hydrolase family 16 protein [Trichoderma citrinoviride]
MFHLLLLLLTIPLALPVLASLKDLSNCDPLKKDAHCPPDLAFATETSFDFTRTSWDDDHFTSFWTADSSTAHDKRQLALNNTDGKGAAFTIWQDGQAPTLTSTKYLLFGKVSVQVQAAKGPGLITAIVLKSDSGDEIDWRNLCLVYGSNSTYPQTPVKLRPYCISRLSSSGPTTTVQNACCGNKDHHPYAAYFLSLQLQDYAGGCNETDDGSGGGGIEYLYDERTTGWQDIDVKGCAKRAAPGEYPPLPPPPSGTSQPTQSEPSAASPTTTTTTTATDGSGGQPTETGDQSPDPSETGAGDDSGNAALPSGRPSSPLAAVMFLLWLLAV